MSRLGRAQPRRTITPDRHALAVTTPPPAVPPLPRQFIQRAPQPRRPRTENQLRAVVLPTITPPPRPLLHQAPTRRPVAGHVTHGPQPQLIQTPAAPPPTPPLVTPLIRHAYPRRIAGRVIRTILPQLIQTPAAPPPTPPLTRSLVVRPQRRTTRGHVWVSRVLAPPAVPPAAPPPRRFAQRPPQLRRTPGRTLRARVVTAPVAVLVFPVRVFVQRVAPDRRRRRLLRFIFRRGSYVQPPVGPGAPTTRETFAPGTSGRSKASGDDGRVGFSE